MKRFITPSILIVLFLATRAAADPISARQIFGGVLIADSTVGDFSVFGPGFNLQGRVDSFQGCNPCVSGAQFIDNRAEVRDLSGTVDGVAYPKLFVAGSNGIPSHVGVQGQLFVPPDAVTGTQIRFQFTTFPDDAFLDRFAGYLSPVLDSSPPAFNFPFSGRGTAVITLHLDGFRDDGTPFYSPMGDIRWQFASPTPEPTSLALFATGLVAIVVRRLRGGASRSDHSATLSNAAK